MQAHMEVGTLWLTRPVDVVAHLTYVASTEAVVTLSGPGFTVRGNFSAPGTSGAKFQPAHGSVAPPPLGTPIRVEYAGSVDQYAFYSRYCWLSEGGDWVIEVPRTVERGDRRLSERHRLARTSGVTLCVTEWKGRPEFVVHDVSVNGLAVISEPDAHPVTLDDLLDCELNLPAEDPVSLCVEVRNIRQLGGPRPIQLVGVQITAITTVDRERLSGFLARRVRDRS